MLTLVVALLLSVPAVQSADVDPQAPAPAAQAEAAFAIVHGPTLQLPTGHSIAVVWHTNRPAVSRVEYGPTEALGLTAIHAEHGLIDNHRTSHTIRLAGLKPGTRYYYRVVSREFLGYEKQHIVRWGDTQSSAIHSFTTLDPAADRFTFAVVSDVHENAARFERVLAGLDWSRVPFVVFNGDMVNDFMTEGQPFAGFVDASVRLFSSERPFVYVRGNHDVRGRFARTLSQYFPTADGRAYYSFDHGPVHVIVLDSGEDKKDDHQYYNGLVAFEPYRREQAEWLARDLASPAARRARFRIVLTHIPPRGDDGFAIDEVRRLWEEAANRGGVDLWLSGHTHRVINLAPAKDANRCRLLVGANDTSIRVDVTRERLVATVVRENGDAVETATVTRRRVAAGRLASPR